MPTILTFQTPLPTEQISTYLIEDEGFINKILGFRMDHNEGEAPGGVEMDLPTNVLFHPNYSVDRATEAMQTAVSRLGLRGYDILYVAFELTAGADCRGRISRYGHYDHEGR
jgi:hypothetical protein